MLHLPELKGPGNNKATTGETNIHPPGQRKACKEAVSTTFNISYSRIHWRKLTSTSEIKHSSPASHYFPLFSLSSLAKEIRKLQCNRIGGWWLSFVQACYSLAKTKSYSQRAGEEGKGPFSCWWQSFPMRAWHTTTVRVRRSMKTAAQKQGENIAPEQALSSTKAKHSAPCTTLHTQSRALTQTRCWPCLGMCTTGNFGKAQAWSCTNLFTTSALLVWFPAGDTLSHGAQPTGQAGFRSTVF